MGQQRLAARIAGEMKPEDIPVAPGVDVDAIKDGDEDPLEVVVEVPEGKSTRNWYYTGESLRDIVNKVNTHTLSGFLGHQKPEEVTTEFPTPVTHWVGAVWKNGKAYFRGIVDKAVPDLKRWIRSKRIRQVSIFGRPKLKLVNGETHVVGYDALSIDWTPLDRAGMPTRVVAMGEMDSTFADGEMDGSHEELRRSLHYAVGAKFGGDGVYVGVERVYDDFVIVAHEKGTTRRLFKVPYTVQNGQVLLGQETEVELELTRTYVPTGEMEGDAEPMKLTEMLAAIRSAIAKGETDLPRVFGEMGVTKEMGLEALVGKEYDKAKKGAEFGAKLAATLGFDKDTNTEAALVFAGEMAELCKDLGLTPGTDVPAVKAQYAAMKSVWEALGFDKNAPEDVAKVAGEMATLYAEQQKSAHAKLVDRLIGEKVAGEMAQGIVKRMLHVGPDATEDQISGEIDALLADEMVKGLIGGAHVDQSPGVGSITDPSKDSGSKTHVRVRPVSL